MKSDFNDLNDSLKLPHFDPVLRNTYLLKQIIIYPTNIHVEVPISIFFTCL